MTSGPGASSVPVVAHAAGTSPINMNVYGLLNRNGYPIA